MMARLVLVTSVFPAVLLLFATDVRAATPAAPVPPAAYVMAGRTFDPNEPLNPPTGNGVQYHVALTGTDSNPGTVAQPFRTIQHGVNALSGGGDTVLIHGGLYREQVSLLSRDAPDGNPFIIRLAGDGEVILDGSTPIPSSGWTSVGGSVYMAHTGPVAGVVVDNQPLYLELTLAGLQATPTVAGVPADYRYYYDSAAQNLYVRIAGGDPGTHDTGVIPYVDFDDSSAANGIFLYYCNNYTLYGLTVRFFSGRGIVSYGCNNARIERNQVVFNAHSGLINTRDNAPTGGHDANHAQIIKNFVHFNFMHNWPRSWPWGGWGGGIGIQGTPYALVEGNISTKNGGEGILAFDDAVGHVTFRNNVSADNWSCSFYQDNLPYGVIEGNLAVAHKPDPANWYNNGISPGDPSGAYEKIIRISRPAGIATGDEDYGNNAARLNNLTVRNNVLVNTRTGHSYGAEGTSIATGGIKNMKFVNNTILVPSDPLPEEDIGGINLPYNGGNNVGSYFENNIIIGGSADTFGMRMTDGSSIPDLFHGLTIDHNLVYMPTNATPFTWGGTWGTRYTHTQWLALAGGAGHGAGDVLTNPNLTNPNTDAALDKTPLPGSPASDAGTAIPAFVTTDFLAVARPQGAGWDMGAFEGGPVMPTLAIQDAIHQEGNAGTTAVTMTIRLSAPSTSPVTVEYGTASVAPSPGAKQPESAGSKQ